jgi:hypothetical protein
MKIDQYTRECLGFLLHFTIIRFILDYPLATREARKCNIPVLKGRAFFMIVKYKFSEIQNNNVNGKMSNRILSRKRNEARREDALFPELKLHALYCCM